LENLWTTQKKFWCITSKRSGGKLLIQEIMRNMERLSAKVQYIYLTNYDIGEDLLGELPGDDAPEICAWDSRISAFRLNRKQSVDQFIKFVRLKTPRVVQHTESELAALWDQWLDYLVATH
jgi:hypothetical protein